MMFSVFSVAETRQKTTGMVSAWFQEGWNRLIVAQDSAWARNGDGNHQNQTGM